MVDTVTVIYFVIFDTSRVPSHVSKKRGFIEGSTHPTDHRRFPLHDLGLSRQTRSRSVPGGMIFGSPHVAGWKPYILRDI